MTAPTMVESIDRGGRGIRVTFAWHRDRFAHVVHLVGGRQQTPVLASREGSDEEAWPPSPALQQLTFQPGSDRQLALLVGMAGKSHWSASIEAVDQAAEVLFDVACRYHAWPEYLGSGYRSMTMVRIDSPSMAALDLGAGGCRFELLEATDTPGPQWHPRADGIDIVLPPTELPPSPATARWKYVIRAG